MDLSVIVVTWNAKKYVEECFGSILQDTQDLAVEIIAVDNASSDGCADLIAERFSQVHLVRSASNLGFPRGNLVALERARGNYVALVNPDVRVLPGCFRKLMTYIQQHPSIGVLGPRILNPDGSLQPSCMRSPSVWNSWCRALAIDKSPLRRLPAFGGQEMADFSGDRTRDVDALNGCFVLIRREAMDQVGFIDERYFMYADDIDWCLRFRNAGWRVVFYHQAQAIHYGGGTTAQAPVYFYVEMQKANLQYWQKHHSRPAQAAYRTSVFAHHLLRYVSYSTVSLFSGLARPGIRLKAQRSLASMRWLLGARA